MTRNVTLTADSRATWTAVREQCVVDGSGRAKRSATLTGNADTIASTHLNIGLSICGMAGLPSIAVVERWAHANSWALGSRFARPSQDYQAGDAPS